MRSKYDPLRTSLTLARGWLSKDLGACVSNWIVSFVLWHLDTYSILSCQNIESTIPFIIHVLCSYQCSYSSIIFNLLQLLTIFSLVIVKTDEIIGSTTMVLLASIEKVSLDSDYLLLLLI